MMANESSSTMVIDEIDRLCVAYDKAKDYISKLSANIDQQMDLWQYRRQVILDQLVQTKSSTSCDFFLPKTQRINDLTIQAVEALCRADLLLEQIHRVDPKSSALLATARPTSVTVPSSQMRQPTPSLARPPPQQPILNGRAQEQYAPPIPVIRGQQQTLSGRLSIVSTQEKAAFKPVQSQQAPLNTLDKTSRAAPSVQPHNIGLHSSAASQYPLRTAYTTRAPQSEHAPSPFALTSASQHASNRQPPRGKERVKLQRISPGTKWPIAKIDIIDSLSGFYIENHDPQVRQRFEQMQNQLHEYYDELEGSNQLHPLSNIAIGDFGVAKYEGDNQWYRARLIMCEEQNRIKIVYVDFGNIEVKSINEFYPLHQLFTVLPAQAIAGSLSQAFPKPQIPDDPTWSEEAIQVFREAVINKVLEVHFVNREEGTEQWPLHFVQIFVNHQSITDAPDLRQCIDPRPNQFIAEQMGPALTEREYILFNIPISDDD